MTRGEQESDFISSEVEYSVSKLIGWVVKFITQALNSLKNDKKIATKKLSTLQTHKKLDGSGAGNSNGSTKKNKDFPAPITSSTPMGINLTVFNSVLTQY